VRALYQGNLFQSRPESWPMVSVVVCAYNAASTIAETLASLDQLNYPDYEVIVVDDGSTDGTGAVAREFNVRLIQVPNGGLSNARNLGITAARGQIIAFIDSDAYADPWWLYYSVSALDEHQASAVGGPNLSPPQDGFMAQCIDESPGNPTCVLVDNEHAEHIPGCNMVFRRAAFDAVGLFDATHRAAGDDVDLCWRLLVADHTIVHHPSAVVWHHRRPTLRTYLRQQKGYGYAEAHLQRRYPGRFNFLGYPVWRGGVYDSVHSHLRREGLPLVFRPRIYQGFFGAAQFQALYQPFLTWWYQAFATFEWLTLSASTLGSGLLSYFFGPKTLGSGLILLSMLMLLTTATTCFLSGRRGAENKKWKGRARWKGMATVGLLHLLQPLARTAGRLKGQVELRRAPPLFAETDLMWGDLGQRDAWLRKLIEHMKSCGWMARPASEWTDADIEILGPGPYRLELISVYEEDLKRAAHYVRFRVRAKLKLHAPIVVGGLMAALIAITQALYLAPLAIPLAFVVLRYAQARKLMVQAASQMALECGWPSGMVRTRDYT
jgi:O-antigen biosynthesis protein